ncbi:MAG: hypothetical protein AAB550_02110 [Patescibacteria group bacterium]
MIATFKQTFESLKNLDYGVQIKKMTLGQALTYWSKYIILIGILALVIGIGAVVYFAPQAPKLITEKMPELPYSWQDNGTEISIDKEKIVFKTPDGKIQEVKVALDKTTIVAWTSANQLLMMVMGIALVLVLVLVIGLFGVLGQLFQMALWTVGFWILGIILKKNLKYLEVFKFVIIASVPALVLDIFGLSLFSMAILAFYTGIWIYRLPRKNK